ncbi:MAG: hypothetical protein JW969_06105 [Spirochaetales bacterium]|nr:hypothetical protein [Spirochaetales bacterium]
MKSLTDQIVSSFKGDTNQKIVVLPFTDLDGGKLDLGDLIAEDLTTQLFLTKKFDIIERKLLDKILNENELAISGIIDETTAKKIGKISGASSICSGTIVAFEKTIKINARLISAETGVLFAVAAVEIERAKYTNELPVNSVTEPDKTPVTVQEKVKAKMEQLFTACKTGNFKNAAPHILVVDFSGGKAKNVRTADYSLPEDKQRVNKMCSEISDSLLNSSGYEFINFDADDEPEGLFYIYTIRFSGPEEPEDIDYVFFTQDDLLGLVEID